MGASGSLWRAVDETLDRTVQVRLLDPDAPRTADVMDAARRVTLAKDPRLAQILDVGTDAGTAFIVIENLPGRALNQIVSGVPLPAVEARRLIGETAQALAGAADRGLHHQRLAPEALIVGTDGSVKVTGTAVEAAATGAESRDAAVATRVDATGLVCLLYAALTGRWPGTTPSTLPPAPRVGGRPVSPVDLVPGVPADLDELCATTLGGGNGGPQSPAELVDRLAPWSIAQPLTNPRGLLLTSPASPGSSSTGARGGAGTVGAGAAATSRTDTVGPGGSGTAAPAAVARNGRTGATAGVGPATGPGAPVGEPSLFEPVVRPAGAPPHDLRGELLADGRGAAARPAPVPTVHRFQGWDDLSTMGIPVQDEEPLLPFAPAQPVERPPRDQSRLVIVVVAVFILAVVLIAALSLRGLQSPASLIPKDTVRPLPTTTAGASRTVSPPAATTSSPPASASPSAGPQLVGAQAIDPHGDGVENNSQAARAVDGDPNTAWKSSYYQTADFAGLKDGVGLVVEVGSSGGSVPDVQQVTVDVAGSGGEVQLRTAQTPGLDGSQVVATAPITSGHAVLTPAKPVNSHLLLLWFTRLPKANGKYQLVVSEVNVR